MAEIWMLKDVKIEGLKLFYLCFDIFEQQRLSRLKSNLNNLIK